MGDYDVKPATPKAPGVPGTLHLDGPAPKDHFVDPVGHRSADAGSGGGATNVFGRATDATLDGIATELDDLRARFGAMVARHDDHLAEAVPAIIDQLSKIAEVATRMYLDHAAEHAIATTGIDRAYRAWRTFASQTLGPLAAQAQRYAPERVKQVSALEGPMNQAMDALHKGLADKDHHSKDVGSATAIPEMIASVRELLEKLKTGKDRDKLKIYGPSLVKQLRNSLGAVDNPKTYAKDVAALKATAKDAANGILEPELKVMVADTLGIP